MMVTSSSAAATGLMFNNLHHVGDGFAEAEVVDSSWRQRRRISSHGNQPIHFHEKKNKGSQILFSKILIQMEFIQQNKNYETNETNINNKFLSKQNSSWVGINQIELQYKSVHDVDEKCNLNTDLITWR